MTQKKNYTMQFDFSIWVQLIKPNDSGTACEREESSQNYNPAMMAVCIFPCNWQLMRCENMLNWLLCISWHLFAFPFPRLSYAKWEVFEFDRVMTWWGKNWNVVLKELRVKLNRPFYPCLYHFHNAGAYCLYIWVSWGFIPLFAVSKEQMQIRTQTHTHT